MVMMELGFEMLLKVRWSRRRGEIGVRSRVLENKEGEGESGSLGGRQASRKAAFQCTFSLPGTMQPHEHPRTEQRRGEETS